MSADLENNSHVRHFFEVREMWLVCECKGSRDARPCRRRICIRLIKGSLLLNIIFSVVWKSLYLLIFSFETVPGIVARKLTVYCLKIGNLIILKRMRFDVRALRRVVFVSGMGCNNRKKWANKIFTGKQLLQLQQIPFKLKLWEKWFGKQIRNILWVAENKQVGGKHTFCTTCHPKVVVAHTFWTTYYQYYSTSSFALFWGHQVKSSTSLYYSSQRMVGCGHRLLQRLRQIKIKPRVTFNAIKYL